MKNSASSLIVSPKKSIKKKSAKKTLAAEQNLNIFPAENPNPVLRVSKNGLLLYANRASRSILKFWRTKPGKSVPAEIISIVKAAFNKNSQGLTELNINKDIYEFSIVPIAKTDYVNIYVRNITDRKKTEVALRESEKKYKDLIKYAPTAIFEVDFLRESFISVNEAMCQITGYSQKELLGKNIFEILDVKSKLILRERINKWLNGEKPPENVEYKIIAKDGHDIYAELKISAQTDKKNQVTGAAIIAHDITERRKMEQELKESERRFRLALKNAPVSVAAQDKDLHFLWAFNQRTIDPATVIGKTDYDLFGREDAERLIALKRKVLATGQEIREQLWLTSGNKRVFLEVYLEPLFDQDNQIIGLGIATVDLTAMKLGEEALTQNEHQLKRAQDIAHLGSWELDLEKGKLSWSDEVYRIFGLQPQEFKASYEAFLEAVYPEDRTTVDAAYNNSLKNNLDYYEIEHRIVKKSTGEIRIVHERCEHFRDDNNKIIRSVGMVHDITERKKAEEILQRDKATLAKLVESKSTELLRAQLELDQAKRLSDIGFLASTVAHELRNPLAAIAMATANIKRKASNPQLENNLNTITKKISESDQIINNLLFYTKLRTPRLEKINLYNIILECLAVAEKQYQKPISITTQLTDIRDIVINADPLQMQEVFSNLLNNAYDAVEAESGKIEFSAQLDQNFIFLSIKDNGCGINPDDLEKILDPFFTTKAKGTGLGLTICHQIIKLHGGQIKIESKVNQGTSIMISLPLSV